MFLCFFVSLTLKAGHNTMTGAMILGHTESLDYLSIEPPQVRTWYSLEEV